MDVVFVKQGDDDGANLFSLEMDSFPPVGTIFHYSTPMLGGDLDKWSDESIEHWEYMKQTDWIVVSNHVSVRNYGGRETPVYFCTLERMEND